MTVYILPITGLLTETKAHVTVMWKITDLQVKAWALWHGGQGSDSGDRRKGTHQHKHSPAVKLVGGSHLEAPAC